VIPVLIEGATMPAPEALPENIRPLARRHAMNLRDDAWDHDVDRLAGVIAGVTPIAKPDPAEAGHYVPRWIVAGAAVVLAGLLIAFLLNRPGADVSSPTPPSTPPAAAIPTQRYGVAVPPVAEVAHRLIYTLISANVTPLGNMSSELRLRFQFANYGRYDANAWDASFRLLVDGQTLAPTGGLNEVVPGRSLRNGIVAFTIPATARGKAVLRVLDGERVGELPLDLSTTLRPAEDERAEIADSLAKAISSSLLREPRLLVSENDVSVNVLRASSRRFANVVRVRFALRYANTGQYPSSGATLRLAVGDQVLAPLDATGVAIEPRSNASADVEFEIPTTATRVVLSGTINQSSGELSVDIPQ
jgi:hypothetical protein